MVCRLNDCRRCKDFETGQMFWSNVLVICSGQMIKCSRDYSVVATNPAIGAAFHHSFHHCTNNKICVVFSTSFIVVHL